ncbi:MAG: hypothetical protein AAF865_01105 [Pseudomonadota bacterium]
MLIPRNAYLQIAGVQLGSFKPLQARNQVPFMTEIRDAEDADGRGYLASEALMLALAEVISNETGCHRGDVRRVIEQHPEVTIRLASAENHTKLFLAVMRFGELHQLVSGEPQDLWEEWHSVVSSDSFRDWETRYPDTDRPWASITMFHVGNVVEGVQARATALGVPLLLSRQTA